MRVIVTRPLVEAQAWTDALARRGIAAAALPLIAIGPPPDGQPLRAAWGRLSGFHAVMFVSGNAVRGFFTETGGQQWPQPSPRAWAPGPGTRAALLEAGVPAAGIDAPGDDAGQFDSEHLWEQVQGQAPAGAKVLLVRGADAAGESQGREWLAHRLEACGVQVEKVCAYARLQPRWSPAERALASQAAQDGSLWLFSSSEAVANLQALLPGQPWRASRALATHPRVAQSARSLGFGSVREARPGLADVVASIESAR